MNLFVRKMVMCILPAALALGCTEYGDFEDHNAPEFVGMDIAVTGTEANVVCRLSSASDRYTEYGFEYWADDGKRVSIMEKGSPDAEFGCVIDGLDYETGYGIQAYIRKGNRRYDFPVETFSTGPDIIDGQFPDESFLGECIRICDTDGDGHLSRSEAARTKELTLLNKVYSLEGIANFPALEILDLNGCALDSVDLSANACLRSLRLVSSKLKTVTLPAGASLSELDLLHNKLKNIDLSVLSSVEALDCSGNSSLTELKIPASKKIRSINCTGCGIKDLDLSGCDELEELHYCDNWNGFSLKLDGCTALKVLELSGTVDFKMVEELKTLESLCLSSVYANYCEELDLSAMSGTLKKLKIMDIDLKGIDFRGCSVLEDATVIYTGVLSLDLSDCSSLKTLDCTNNPDLVSVTVPIGVAVEITGGVEVKYV